MTHEARDAVQHPANRVGHPSQLAHDLDLLMNHLDAVQPEHGAPQRRRDIEVSSVQMRTPRLWDRLKDAARQLVHPQIDTTKHTSAPVPDRAEVCTEGAGGQEHGMPVVLPPVNPQPPPLPAVTESQVEQADDRVSFSHAPSCAFSINGHVIQQRDGFYKLDDLYKYGRVAPRKTPRKFLGSVRAKAALNSLNAPHPNTRPYKVSYQVVWGAADLLLAYADWCGLSDVLNRHDGVVGTKPDAVQPGELVVNGRRIRYQPDHQWYNLGDLRKASGYEYNRAPRVFLKTNSAQALVAELSRERDANTLLHAGNPGGGGHLGVIWACRELMLAYAKWLSPMMADAVLAALDTEDARLEQQPVAPSPCVAPLGARRTVDASTALLNIVLESGWPVIHRERGGKSYVLVDVNSFGGREIERLWRAMNISQPDCNVPCPRQVALSAPDITAWAFEVPPAINGERTPKNGVAPDEEEKATGQAETGQAPVPVQASLPQTASGPSLSVDISASLGSVTMTSGDIAELTGKRHDNVKRTIEALLTRNVIRSPQIEETEEINNLGLNRKVKRYIFRGREGRRDSIVLVAQLSPESVDLLIGTWNRGAPDDKSVKVVTKNAPANVTSPLDSVQIDVDALSDELTMSSLDIAELANKQHRNVLRDIRGMLIELYGEGGMLKFEHTHVNPQNNRIYPVFRLPKDLVLTLVSGYSMVLRKRIIDRWLELERRAAIGAFGIPQTLQEALRMAADLLDENQTLRLENQSLKQLTGPTKDETAGQAGSVLSATASALSTKELAHTFGIKLTDLCRFLREDGLLKRASNYFHVPTQRALSDGLFAFRPLPHNPHYLQTVATEKGLTHIHQRLAARGLLNKRA